VIRTACCVFALYLSAGRSLADPPAQEPPTRGSQETTPAPKAHVPSVGLTMEMLNGLPRTRTPVPTYQSYYYQPYAAYGGYPAYGYNAAFSWPHPFGMGGYYPQRVGGYGGWGGWGGWGWGW
jgi:hypothetical protein